MQQQCNSFLFGLCAVTPNFFLEPWTGCDAHRLTHSRASILIFMLPQRRVLEVFFPNCPIPLGPLAVGLPQLLGVVVKIILPVGLFLALLPAADVVPVAEMSFPTAALNLGRIPAFMCDELVAILDATPVLAVPSTGLATHNGSPVGC